MKIFLNKKEQKLLSKFLNSNGLIKTIKFETSKFYIERIARLLVEMIDDISQSYRVGYKYNSKTGEILFIDDFQELGVNQWKK